MVLRYPTRTARRLGLALLIVCGLLTGHLAPAQSVQIGAPGTPDPQAALDIRAANKGLLIPRLDSAQRAALAPPSDGLMVFQKDGRVGLWYAFGGTWFYIPDKVKAGDNLGNHTATRPFNLQNQLLVGANTLNGTPSATGLRITSKGFVGIGTDAAGPTQLLELGSITSQRPAFLRLGSGNGGAYRQWEVGLTLNAGDPYDVTGENYDFTIRDATVNQTRLMIDYFTGRVGIGTSEPAATLHVLGGARFSDLAGTGVRLVTADKNGELIASTTLPFSIPGDNLGDHLATQPLVFASGDDDKLLLIESYGANGPKLSHSFGWNLDYYAGSLTAQAPAQGTHRFFSGGAARVERMRLTETGRLGIGTTTPRGALDVAAPGDLFLTADPANGNAQIAYMPGDVYLAPYNAVVNNTSFIQARIPDPEPTTNLGLQFRTTHNGAARDALKLDPDGRVGIGTIAPRGALDVAAPGNLFLTANPANGDAQIAYMPGDVYLAPYSSVVNNTSFIQARIPTPTATTNLGLQLRTTHNGAARDALKLDPDGKVGVGTTTPAYTLDVAGTVQAQTYRYATPQTRYLSIPATAFVAASATYRTEYTWAGGGAPASATYVNLTGGTAGQSGSLVAPVYLPEGALVTGLELSAFDKDSSPIAPSATFSVVNNQATVVSVATAQLTAEANAPQTITQPYSHTVLNQTNSYSLTVQLNQNSPATRLVCVRIAYTIQQPE